MKASKLIKKLTGLMETHGDLNIYFRNYEWMIDEEVNVIEVKKRIKPSIAERIGKGFVLDYE